jgi:hypothetical protein
MTIYMMWYQGFDAAPRLVQRVHALWQQLNPDETLHFVASEEANDLISDAGIDPAQLTMQVRANIVRVSLLAAQGGTWADATLLPSAPLQSWLDAPLSQTGFFCFSNDHRDRLISNWFLAAKAGNPLMSQWKDRYCDYFRTPRRLNKTGPRHIRLMQDLRAQFAPSSFGRPDIAARSRYYPYFIQHYIFAHLVETDPLCADLWGRVPKVSGGTAGRLKAACNRHSGRVEATQLAQLYHAFPVHKLNWRKPELFGAALDLAEAHAASNAP